MPKSGILGILPSWFILSLKPKGKGDCKNLIHFGSVLCLFIYFNLGDVFGSYIFFQLVELKLYWVNDHYF